MFRKLIDKLEGKVYHPTQHRFVKQRNLSWLYYIPLAILIIGALYFLRYYIAYFLLLLTLGIISL